MKIKTLLSLLVLLCIAWTFTAFTKGEPKASDSVQDEKEVMAVIHAFFEGMRQQDTASLNNIMMKGSQFYAYIEGDSTALIHRSSNASWLKSLVNEEVSLVERIWDTQIKVHKGIATVWTPYDLYANGAFVHCGINAFNLIKNRSGWKLADAVFTIEKNCKESPLGPFELGK